MGATPHTKCCGCCCGLQTGCIVGAVLFSLLYLLGIVAGSLRAPPDTDQATLFCAIEDADYKEPYNSCYGSDICADDDFDGILAKASVSGWIGIVVTILCLSALGATIFGAVQRNEKGIGKLWKVLFVFPALFLLTTIVGAAMTVHSVHISTVTDYYERAAREKICYDTPGVESLDIDDWDGKDDVKCSDSDNIGVPDASISGGGPFRGANCATDSLISVSIAFSLVFTLIFNVGLLGYLAFHVYSYHKEMLAGGPGGGGGTGTQMQPPVASAVAQPAVAVATPAVAVATPAVAVATPAVAVATPAVAVAIPVNAA